MNESKAAKLRQEIQSKELSFFLEAHNALSAQVVEEAGFSAIWASSLTMSAAAGCRDNNELSWTQVVDNLELMADATKIPILVDGDTGYGNFNNMQRLVKKLETHSIAGVCIEDKRFPKTNSFIAGEKQELASIDEFSGKIKAAKDTQSNPDFSVVARVEAFIAGFDLGEALKRAEAYLQAGADAIVIHSKISTAKQVLDFEKEWAKRSPLIIIPTKYYTTDTEIFRQAGFNVVIWANHLLRSSLLEMQNTAKQIFQEETLLHVENKISPIAEIFRLQGAEELQAAEAQYLPKQANDIGVVILAASQSKELGQLTQDIPKTMVPLSGKPVLQHIAETLRYSGLNKIGVVCGYKKDSVDLEGIKTIANDNYDTTKEVYSLSLGIQDKSGPLLITYGDVLFQKHILHQLLEAQGDIILAVDPDWESSKNKNRHADYIECSETYNRYKLNNQSSLKKMTPYPKDINPNGEWIGMLKLSANGLEILKSTMAELESQNTLKNMRMFELFDVILDKGHKIDTLYIKGTWFDLDEATDFILAAAEPQISHD